MKTKIQTFISIFLLLTVGTNLIYAQTETNEKSASKILEPAKLRIIYAFSQKAEKDRVEIIITDTMALTIGQNYSVYYDWNKERNDSIQNKISNIPIEKIKSVNVMKDESLLQSRLERMQEPTFITDDSKGESARIYKNRSKSEIITIDKGPSEGFNPPVRTNLQVIENVAPQEWVISEDTLTVLGYTCQKAETTFRGRNYTAWFTLNIPINEGPWKLYGLPGVILKADDAEDVFQFQAIGINQISKENIEVLTDRKIVPSTLKQLYDYRKNRFKEVAYGFFEEGTLNLFRGKNPIIFQSLEKE